MHKHSKIVVAVPVILLLILLVSAAGTGCKFSWRGIDTVYVTVPDTVFVQVCPKVEHHIYITKDGQRCKIADENNNTEIAVNSQDWVTWHNKYGGDVQLTFGGSRRLFGVLKAIVYSDGSPLSLQVNPDAASGRHGYQGNCGITEPGPVIIVNPPN